MATSCNSFANGNDECQRIELSLEDAKNIIEAIRSNRLPKTSGFFFGESDNDLDQQNEAIKIFEGAITWLNKQRDGEIRSIVYQASW